MKYYMYILQSEKDQSFYVGSTGNLPGRLVKHNSGKSIYTSRKMPWKIVYSEEFDTRAEAVKRERFIKAQRNRQFYHRLIDSKK